MSIGDQDDITARIKATLPPTWFPSSSPTLDAVLAGFANAAAWVYSLIIYAKQQTRILTATDGWLDMIANDFFGRRMVRGSRSDASFRAAIIAEIFRSRQTRQAIIDVLLGLTGRAPVIFEPARPQDTGGYSPGPSGDGYGRNLAYGLAGGYGSLLMPYEILVRAFRPATAGIPSVAGYGGGSASYATPSGSLPVILGGGWPGGLSVPASGPYPDINVASTIGGYSTPSAVQYGNLDMIEGAVTDGAIYEAVNNVRAAGITAWTTISN